MDKLKCQICGYDCLVIWENEIRSGKNLTRIKNDLTKIKNKIIKFHKENNYEKS